MTFEARPEGLDPVASDRPSHSQRPLNLDVPQRNFLAIATALLFGGAIVPLIMGSIADTAGYTWAFFVPAACYLYIFFFAVKGSKMR